MNTQVALLGLIEVASSLSCGLLILFITYRLARVYGQKKLGITERNTAYDILIALVLFSVGYIMSGVIPPILDAFRMLANQGMPIGALIGKFLLFGGFYIAIAYMGALLVLVLGIFTYTYLTPMDELAEIRNNNIGVALVVGAIMVVLAMMSSNGIILIIESLVPYPEFYPS